MDAFLCPTPERLTQIARQFEGRRVVVVGDLIADQFLYGEIARVSREAPVLILRHERTDTVPGGAANCAANLAALGAQTSLIGMVGDDEPGRALLSQLKASRINCDGVIVSPKSPTTTKVRILAGQVHSTRQQVIRVDYEGAVLADPKLQESFCASLRHEFPTADASIISDYNYGVAGDEVTRLLQEMRRARNIPVVVDSRFRLTNYQGFTSATPNEDELEHALTLRLDNANDIESAASVLRAQLNCEALLVTRGPEGMLLQATGRTAYYINAVGARDPVDVTGAGDTVIAAYTLGLAVGATFAESAHIANHAGGLVVMKRGTASVSLEELLSSICKTE